MIVGEYAMDIIKKIFETNMNGLKVNLFELSIENEEGIAKIKEYLISKIKISKVHNADYYDLKYYGSQTLEPEFVARFNDAVKKICVPKKHSIHQFDVRRERVTEWMAQYLLEEKYGCKFYDEADKRINLEPVSIDKHTDGIDVPGILIENDKIRFVVCEVKASETHEIPCSSARDLQSDIQKSINNLDNRVTREILEYMHSIKNVKIQDDLLNKIVIFLSQLIAGEKQDLAENIMFFPLLLRNNKIIVSKRNIDDYKNFKLYNVKHENVENIILAFEQDLSEFSNKVYEEAIGN